LFFISSLSLLEFKILYKNFSVSNDFPIPFLPDNNLQNSGLKTFLFLSFVIIFIGIDLNSPLF